MCVYSPRILLFFFDEPKAPDELHDLFTDDGVSYYQWSDGAVGTAFRGSRGHV